MTEYKNIEKIKPEVLLELAREYLDKSDHFNYISGIQPFLMSFKEDKFYIYIKNISSAYFSERDKTTRAQLPIKSEFDNIKKSNIPFIFLGYDYINDVFVCWNYHIAKRRLNVGKSVSFYSRTFYQSEVKDGEFIRRKLKNGDIPVFFKRAYLVDFFNHIKEFFPEDAILLVNTTNIEVLEFQFVKYMTEERNLKEKSIKNYLTALKGVITTAVKENFLSNIDSIFDIQDLDLLSKIKSKLFTINRYKEIDSRGKKMYSCALDNYINFISNYKKSINNNFENNLINGKLTKITDPVVLEKITPYINSNRYLSAAQVLGDYYLESYPDMELKDWLNVLRKL